MRLRKALAPVALAGAALTQPALAQDPYGDAAPSASPSAAPDAADAVKQTCLDSFMRAQRLRRKGQLVSARAELVSCGQPDCPDAIEGKCVEWLEEVRAAIPTIIVAAQDHQGRDITAAELAVDDDVVAAALDGKPVDVDPGPHKLKVSYDRRSQTQDILAAQGVKNRVVKIKFDPPPKPPEPPPFTLPAMSWAGFGIAAAGVIVGGITGVVAIVKGHQLANECADLVCYQYQKAEFESGRAVAHTSTASFAVAGAGAIVGIVGLIVFRPPKKPENNPPEKGPDKVTLVPLFGPTGIGVMGRF